MTQPVEFFNRLLNGRLLVRMQVDEAFAEAAVVVAGGDAEKAGRVLRGGDGRLRGANDGGEIVAVDDDFHHGADAGWELRFGGRVIGKLRAEFFVCTGE